jgi:TPR repeat protein
MARMDMSTVEMTELAAQTGMPDALFDLGLIYSTGRDVEPDLVTAHKWFNLAASRGNISARDYRMQVAREMSEAQVAEAQRRAREWLSKH